MSNNLEKGAAAIRHDLTMLRRSYECQQIKFAYTAWFVHYRALLEFFECSGSDAKKDLLPTEYINNWKSISGKPKRPDDPDRADEYKAAANALVSHMSKERIIYISNQAQRWTPNKELTEYLRELGRDFVKRLPDDKKLWFTDLKRELNEPLGEILEFKVP